MNAQGNTIWYPSFYDCDSELGLTNDGELRYGSGIDVTTDNFNTSDSYLWTKLNTAFAEEIQTRYINLRANGYISYDTIISYYEAIINKVGETFYNEDARIKYINDNNKAYVYMCNGSRLEHTRRWVSERITYMDSVYGYGDYQLSATIRSNVTGEVTLRVKTYSPQYVEISFSDSATGTVKKWCDKDKWYTFTNTISNAVDNNITIRGITNVMYIEGLEDLNVSSMIMKYAKKLCKIDIHGSKRIQRLELGSNEMLQTLNCKNCSNLGYDDNYKVIDLSQCINLKYLDLSGTMVGTVDLNPKGGALEYCDLSNTEITYLTCNYQEYLPEIKLDGCRNLSSVMVNGCNALTRLSLPNSKLAEFKVTDCNKLDYLDISYTGYLTSLDLTGCESLSTLIMSGISNNKFIELDARTLINLKTLNVSKCDFLSNIRFANGYKKLTNLDVQQSGIKTFQFGNNAKPAYLDLSPFTLSTVNFYNCTQVEEIRGINLYATSTMNPFYNCKNLVTIKGTVNLMGSTYRAFYGCEKLTNLPTFNFERVTSAADMFLNCKMLTYTQMLMILRQLKNCTQFSQTFYGCSNISSDGIYREIFDVIPKATYFYYTFDGTNIKGQLETGVFDSLTNLQTMNCPFGGGKVTGIIPANLFKNNTNLVTAVDIFAGCTELEVASNISTMFTNCTKLETIYGLFGGCTNAVIIFNPNWFTNCPNLKNVNYTFKNCKNLMGTITNGLFSGKTKLTSAYETFYGCDGLNGMIPNKYFEGCTNLVDIHGHFQNCTGLSGVIPSDFWSDCRNIADASYLFSGCTGLGGTSSLQEIPTNFFEGKYRLDNANYMFNDCNQLQFLLQSEWFKDCRLLTKISRIFSGCTNAAGEIPADLFTVRDENGEIMETVMLEATGVFYNCRYLNGEIPSNLFEKFLKVRDLSNFFYNCLNLQGGIPDELFANCYQVTNINSMFYRCEKLGKYSDEITEENPYFCNEYLFMNCTNLMYANNVFNMYNVESQENLAGEIPPTLFMTCSKLEELSYTFAWCNKLTGGLDGQLFARCPKLKICSGTFYGCSGLNGEISGALFSDKNNPNITTFVECFTGCSNLKGNAPTIWSQFSGAERVRCFQGCTKLDNYSDIPDGWK
jgi:hypothetical protein